MKRSQIAVLGAGGHAKVALDVLVENGFRVTHFVTRMGGGSFLGRPVISEDDLRSHSIKKLKYVFPAVGENSVRVEISRWALESGFSLPTAVSRFAWVSKSAELGPGCLVAPGAVVNSGCSIGDFSIINTKSSVDHDCDIGLGVHIAPGVSLAGGVSIGSLTLMGVASCVRPAISVGTNVIIGAGSVVVSDIPSNSVAFGNPARIKIDVGGP